VNVERVRPPPSRFDRYLGLISAFIAGALLVAIVKPWGSGGLPASVPLPTPSPRPSDSPAPELGYESRVYDPSIFGTHEPEATWAIWPAGFLVTFGFVIQVPGLSAPTPGTSPGASSGPSATTASARPAASGLPSPAGGAGTPVGDPVWPARFDVPNGNHLLLIGINMPSGHSVAAVQLMRVSDAGALDPVAISQFPSPWPAHFAVIGVPTSPGDNRLTVWPPGRYRLDLTFNPGAVMRSIEISILSSVDGP
jgi:hypothetical protein